MKSLGFVEVSGVTAAIDALDIMCKSADVTLVSWERKLGGRLVTIIVTGTVSAVNAAVENAAAQCIKKPCATAVFFRFFFIIGHCKTLSVVPCAYCVYPVYM